jgi:hypothetical protein
MVRLLGLAYAYLEAWRLEVFEGTFHRGQIQGVLASAEGLQRIVVGMDLGLA